MSVLSRREFLRVSTLLTATTLGAACVPPSAPAEPSVPDDGGPTAPSEAPGEVSGDASLKEAPMLSDLVQSGSLPAAEERVPENPRIIGNMDGSIGNYGGGIRRGMKGVSDKWGPDKYNRETLVFFAPDLGLSNEIAESWEANEDASEFTFHLRKGMKWSDGEPFTTNDIKFWYDNELTNRTVSPIPSRAYTVGEDAAVVQMSYPDGFTAVFKFAGPYPLFVYQIAQSEPYVPAHYMGQFHADVTDDEDALDAMVKESGFDSWDQLYADKGFWMLNAERPVLHPYIAVNTMHEELFVMERKPYFHQVDPAGNQLPYIDYVNHRLFDSADVFDMWILNGEIDFQNRHVSVTDYTLLKQGEEAGDYTIQNGIDDGVVVLTMNQTVDDEQLREFFTNKAVHIALSYAINRQEINDLIYDGLGTPKQFSPLPTSPQAYDELASAYLDYDPERANQLLDDAGYAERSAEGIRLFPDGSGKEISIIFETIGTGDADLIEMVIKYLADVGIKAVLSTMERSLWYEHWESNILQATVAKASRTAVPIVDPSMFMNLSSGKLWSAGWRNWYYDPTGPNAIEPPPEANVSRMWALWDQIKVSADPEVQNTLFRQILDIWKEELPMIGLIGLLPGPFVVKNGLHAFAEGYKMPLSNPLLSGGLVPPQTYYWEEPEKHM